MSEVQDSYNVWAKSYDAVNNKTRDLDQIVTTEVLSKYKFTQVLELGCGTGKNTSFLDENSEFIVAFDFSEEMLTKAKAKNYKNEIIFKRQDLNEVWDVNDEDFDLITASLVLEHIENLDHIFLQASEKLIEGGYFFISEYHPFKQYNGKKANFEKEGVQIDIPAFVHHTSEYLNAAKANGFKLIELNEFFDEGEGNNPPRILNLVFQIDL